MWAAWLPSLEPGISYSRATGLLVQAEQGSVVLPVMTSSGVYKFMRVEVSELNSNHHIHAVIKSVLTSRECVHYCYSVGACISELTKLDAMHHP